VVEGEAARFLLLFLAPAASVAAVHRSPEGEVGEGLHDEGRLERAAGDWTGKERLREGGTEREVACDLLRHALAGLMEDELNHFFVWR
jgi:hypothetical protein